MQVFLSMIFFNHHLIHLIPQSLQVLSVKMCFYVFPGFGKSNPEPEVTLKLHIVILICIALCVSLCAFAVCVPKRLFQTECNQKQVRFTYLSGDVRIWFIPFESMFSGQCH